MARAPVTAAPAPVNTPPVALAPPVEESQAPPAQAEPEVPAVTVSSDVADAQRLLARLGYNVGPADGYTGPRTAAAVRAFQQANGMWADGVIDEALLVALEDKADERDQRLRPAWKTQGAVMPPAPSIATGRDSLPPTAHRSPSTARSSTTGSGESENTVSSIVSGLQRMIGHEFDSVHAPGDLRAFCNAHSDNWVYDEGTGRFLFCAEVNAGIVGDSRQVVRPR
jgi:peptidoglycan hydrolase-like protein with peptidoglycan-binding domain